MSATQVGQKPLQLWRNSLIYCFQTTTLYGTYVFNFLFLFLIFTQFSLFCSGLTQSNYKELKVVYEKYKDKGTKLILMPISISFFINRFWVGTEMVEFVIILMNCFLVDFEILAFPCNQFVGQEPGNNEEIQDVLCTRFKAELPIFAKVILINGKKSKSKASHRFC